MDRALWIELLGAREMVCATSGRRASRDLQEALQLFFPTCTHRQHRRVVSDYPG